MLVLFYTQLSHGLEYMCLLLVYSLPCMNCIYKSKPNTRAGLIQEISRSYCSLVQDTIMFVTNAFHKSSDIGFKGFISLL